MEKEPASTKYEVQIHTSDGNVCTTHLDTLEEANDLLKKATSPNNEEPISLFSHGLACTMVNSRNVCKATLRVLPPLPPPLGYIEILPSQVSAQYIHNYFRSMIPMNREVMYHTLVFEFQGKRMVISGFREEDLKNGAKRINPQLSELP